MLVYMVSNKLVMFYRINSKPKNYQQKKNQIKV